MRKSNLIGLAGILLLVGVVYSTSTFAQNGVSFTAIPATITFTANSPGSNIAGSSNATITWSRNGKPGGTWTLSVGTAATTFTGCTTVPRSAVSVRCASAVHSLTAQNGSANCSATSFTTLPGTIPGLQVATGAQASTGNNGGQVDNFTVTLNYQLADSWRFLPNICPLSLTYTLVAP